MLVAHAERESVELGLDGVLDGLDVEPLARAAVEVEHVLVGEGVLERQHRHRVHHRRELAQRGRADALGRRIGGRQFRVGGLELAQFERQAIVLGVRELRVVEHVITVIVVLDLLAQFAHAGRRVLRRPHARLSRRVRRSAVARRR